MLIVVMMGKWCSNKTPHADICTNCVYTIPVPRVGGPIPFFGQAGRRSLPPGWLCSSQKRSTSSQIMARRHTQTNTLQSSGFVSSVINKKQSSIRCNHTHNTRWVHLNCPQIKQRQYQHDWRRTIHTPTQNVTTTPSTDNTTPPS